MKPTLSLHGTITQLDRGDKVVEGLRIPANLNTTTAVSFVLTQEPGKLKPKDLKAAIEKNRAEREFRAEEQRKLREEGGGLGGLDLRAILAEEKFNINDGDAFKRQLREIAFLADVEEIEKQETEKEFRISEDYNGHNLLSEQDIQVIYQQREMARLHQKKNQWNTFQSRDATQSFAPIHPTMKPGVFMEEAVQLVNSLVPSFDPNRNDIWSKRLNTLRKLISLVGRWIIQHRVEKRMKKILQYFHTHSAFTRAEIRAFIIHENLDQSQATLPSKEKASKSLKQVQFGGAEEEVAGSIPTPRPTLTMAELILSHPHMLLENRKRNELIIQQSTKKIKQGEAEFNSDMIRRSLFPSYERNSLQLPKAIVSLQKYITKPIAFNDTTYYHTKTKPEYYIRSYMTQSVPNTPLYLPVYTDTHAPLVGGYEELAGRYPADQNMLLSAYEKVYLQSKDALLVSATSSGIDLLHALVTSWPDPHARPAGEVLRGMDDPQVNPPTRPLTSEEDLITLLTGRKPKLGTSLHVSNLDEQVLDEDEDDLPAWMQSKSSSSSSSIPLPEDWLQVNNSKCYFAHHELDAFTAYPQFRTYTPYLPRPIAGLDIETPFVGSNNTESLIPRNIPDGSLRQTWQSEGNHGFGAVNCYFLGSLSSSILRYHDYDINTIPTMGPTLSNAYLPDSDRHHSGLSCYHQDHLRDTNEWDGDVNGLQSILDKKDILTDSESDSEEGNNDEYYQKYKPSMQLVKTILTPPVVIATVPATNTTAAPNKKGGGKGAPVPTPAPVVVAAPPPTIDATEVPLLADEDKKEEQVELLRDRKLLEIASGWTKQRQIQFENVYNHLLSRQQQSQQQRTPFNFSAMHIQAPFHTYEQEVYNILASKQVIPEIENHILIEFDPHRKVAVPAGAATTLNSMVAGNESFSSPTTTMKPAPPSQK